VDGFVAELRCAVCGDVGGRVELVAPGAVPVVWETWPASSREVFRQHRPADTWYLVYRGIEAGNGLGDTVDADRARQLAAAFAEPLSYGRIHGAGLYDDAGWCGECDVPYCGRHWRPSETGHGRCPKGHEKSLDPHGHPRSEDL
jgi:hypothetical protein